MIRGLPSFIQILYSVFPTNLGRLSVSCFEGYRIGRTFRGAHLREFSLSFPSISFDPLLLSLFTFPVRQNKHILLSL